MLGYAYYIFAVSVNMYAALRFNTMDTKDTEVTKVF